MVNKLQITSVIHRILTRIKNAFVAFIFKLIAILLVLSSCNQLINDAIASSMNETMGVTVTVPANCNFSAASSMNFGSYNPRTHKRRPLDSTANVQIRCTKNVTATISMNNGQNYSAPNRQMINPVVAGNYLAYQLYRDSARTAIWDTSNTVTYHATTSAPASITVYGRIFQNQNPVGGSYTDTILVTASF